jgi:hypothetical protein
MKDKKMTEFFLKMFKENPDFSLARDIIWITYKNFQDGFCNETEYIERIRFLYSIFKQCFDKSNVFDLFGMYDDLKYVLSQKDADEILDNSESIFGYRSQAASLYRNGFEIKEPAKHFLKLIDKTNASAWTNILSWMDKKQENEWSSGLDFISKEDYAKLAVNIYDMVLKGKLYTNNNHYVWELLVKHGNNISQILSYSPEYKKAFNRLLQELKFNEDKFTN